MIVVPSMDVNILFRMENMEERNVGNPLTKRIFHTATVVLGLLLSLKMIGMTSVPSMDVNTLSYMEEIWERNVGNPFVVLRISIVSIAYASLLYRNP